MHPYSTSLDFFEVLRRCHAKHQHTMLIHLCDVSAQVSKMAVCKLFTN